MMRRPEAVLIAGPTASGKSALALGLAQRLGGRIINADSMQVYRDLRVLTARPDEAEMASVPHVLYGMIDGAQNYSVSLWLASVRAEFEDAKADGLLPILVGGTGLYFKALTQGLSDIPPIPAGIRTTIRDWASGRETNELHDELARRDPITAARLRPTDPQRILRAIEVHEATGKSLASFQACRAAPMVDNERSVAIALSVDREILRRRIDQRFDAMILAGGLEEASHLAARRLDPTLPIMRAIGIPPLLRHLAGEMNLNAAVSEAKTTSRQYIKRQETFVRHQLPSFQPVTPDQAETTVMAWCQS